MELEESEPETGVWKEVEENVLDDIEPPDFVDQDSLELSASKSNVYAMWIINFIMVMQAVVTTKKLHFLSQLVQEVCRAFTITLFRHIYIMSCYYTLPYIILCFVHFTLFEIPCICYLLDTS